MSYYKHLYRNWQVKNDPFGHIAIARFYLEHSYKELKQAKEDYCKKIWQDNINRLQQKINDTEKAEINFWETM